MDRHDPLSSICPATAPAPTKPAPEPAKPLPEEAKRVPKTAKRQPARLAPTFALPDDATLAFLYGGPNQTPAALERNNACAAQIRADFTAFCLAHPKYRNWRTAWSAWRAACNVIPVNFAPEPVPAQVPVGPRTVPRPQAETIVEPAWRRRLRAFARS